MSRLLQDRVASAAESRPDAAALVMGSERLTYRELDQRSNQLARLLIDHGVRRGDRVCLLQPKAPAAIVSMLATLKAGAIYVPVDIASPVRPRRADRHRRRTESASRQRRRRQRC